MRINIKINEINTFVKDYQAFIQTIGIIVAVGALWCTSYSTRLSYKALKLATQQEYNKQLPIWSWNIIDSISVVELRPFNPDIKLQIADAIFPINLFKDDSKWPINQPDFKLHLTMFKYHIAKILREKNSYESDKVYIKDRGFIPFGLKINYIQYGVQREIFGLFSIQFTYIISSGEPKISIDGIMFNKYLNKHERPEEVVNKLTEDIFKQQVNNE